MNDFLQRYHFRKCNSEEIGVLCKRQRRRTGIVLGLSRCSGTATVPAGVAVQPLVQQVWWYSYRSSRCVGRVSCPSELGGARPVRSGGQGLLVTNTKRNTTISSMTGTAGQRACCISILNFRFFYCRGVFAKCNYLFICKLRFIGG